MLLLWAFMTLTGIVSSVWTTGKVVVEQSALPIIFLHS